MKKCPICNYHNRQENASQYDNCPGCEIKEALKWIMIKGAAAYVQSTPHHQIEIDIIRNLKASDTLYMRGTKYFWELHANCPDYLESLDLRITLHKQDNPKAKALWDLYHVVDGFRGYWLSQLSREYLVRRLMDRLDAPMPLIDIPTEMPIKQVFELVLNTYIKEFLS